MLFRKDIHGANRTESVKKQILFYFISSIAVPPVAVVALPHAVPVAVTVALALAVVQVRRRVLAVGRHEGRRGHEVRRAVRRAQVRRPVRAQRPVRPVRVRPVRAQRRAVRPVRGRQPCARPHRPRRQLLYFTWRPTTLFWMTYIENIL